jgi:hypothetical protein
MYPMILGSHNLIRWAAFILTIVAAARAWQGWRNNRPWTRQDRRIGSYLTIAMDIQLLLGLALYFLLSPLTRSAAQNVIQGAGAPVGFFSLEHPLGMLLAVVFAHLGNMQPRRALKDKLKHRQAAIWFTLAFLLLVVLIPWNRPLFPWFG